MGPVGIVVGGRSLWRSAGQARGYALNGRARLRSAQIAPADGSNAGGLVPQKQDHRRSWLRMVRLGISRAALDRKDRATLPRDA